MLSFLAATLVSALAFYSTLVLAIGPRTQCVEKSVVPQDATCASIEQNIGINRSAIETMNPGVLCNTTLTVGNYLCTKQYTPICTLNETATTQKCDQLAAKWNITTSEFVQYNDDVDDACDDLVPGNPYCVSIDGCYPGNTSPICNQ
ncbi:hypothetical protein F5148DRAFT_689899 [Russula earlei]|uniref:Uncharacterized protein n=1 Tax=Russula earlei TaxID=71964 RepID=A0ACC0TTU5_9AGAM|nr:hypothetical protein F5148DRAFT_689899 [Russula earlei]